MVEAAKQVVYPTHPTFFMARSMLASIVLANYYLPCYPALLLIDYISIFTKNAFDSHLKDINNRIVFSLKL